MNKSDKLNLPSPGKAATDVARLFRHGNVPNPDAEEHARMVLVASRIDKEIRAALAGSPIGLEPQYAAHLVGLLLSYGSQDEFAVERLARCIREAFYVTPNVKADDRAAIAQMVLGAK